MENKVKEIFHFRGNGLCTLAKYLNMNNAACF